MAGIGPTAWAAQVARAQHAVHRHLGRPAYLASPVLPGARDDMGVGREHGIVLTVSAGSTSGRSTGTAISTPRPRSSDTLAVGLIAGLTLADPPRTPTHPRRPGWPPLPLLSGGDLRAAGSARSIVAPLRLNALTEHRSCAPKDCGGPAKLWPTKSARSSRVC